MIMAKDIKIISALMKDKNMMTVNYKILVLNGIEDTIDILKKDNKLVVKSDLLPTLKLPKKIERELMLAIIDATQLYYDNLN